MESQDIGVRLHIPTSVAQAIRLPEKRIVQNLLEELAVALYAQELVFWQGQRIGRYGKVRVWLAVGRAWRRKALWSERFRG